MTKRKTLLAVFSFAMVLSLALIFGVTLSGGTLTAHAAGAPSAVTVNAQNLYSGYYLESNDSTTYSIGATTEPATYVAWYDGVTLTLNGYNGGEISVGGAIAVDLTIKLKGKNTITSSDRGIFASDCKNLVIDADSEATLNINVSSSTKEVYGISVGQGATATTGAVTIRGKATVNINAETSASHAYGIYTKTGFNIVGSANLSINNTSSDSASYWSYSIVSFEVKPVFNTDGIVTLDNSECFNRTYCISANNGIDIKKGTLICRYKPGNNTSYACSKSIKTAPEGCVLRENPYYLGETVIKSGEGHTVTVENGTDYYGKDSNQYVADETVYVKTDIEGLKFDKWEGTGVTFAGATQKETTFTMIGDDVAVRAVYDVFAKQPVFERISNKQGSISVQLNKSVSNTSDIKLVKSTGEVDVNVSFDLDPASDGFTYTCSQVWANYTAGTYKIRVEYGGDYFYSNDFEIDYTDKTPFAEVSDIIVSGKTGREITPVSFDVTLTYATFKAIAEGTDVSSWFDYNALPKGLVAKISAVSEGATSATITISGTPATELSGELYLTIPTKFLATGNDNAVLSKENANAKFNIAKPENHSVTVEDGRSKVNGNFQSIALEGTTVTIVANEISGKAFDKWIVVSGDVTFANENDATTTFVMPESDVRIKATYKTIVSSIKAFVTAPVKDNTADTTTMNVIGTGYSATNVEWYKGEDVVSSMQMSASDKFIAGEKYTVVVTLTVNPGYVFAGDSALSKSINGQAATLNSGSGTDTITIKTTLDVPTEPIPEHSVTVENGTLASGTTTGNFAEGSSVTVSANAPASDMMFDKWTATGITLSSEQLSSQTVTFTMGTSDVTIKATYKAIPKYTVTITDGKLTGGATTGSFKSGEIITITADTKDGFTFGKWTAEGITLTSEQLSAATITITVGTNNITLTATYEEVIVPAPKYKVTVENGSADGDEFKMGQVVTITADTAPEGKEFDKWVVVSGEVTLANLNNKKTTFVMPESDVEIKATYKDVVVPTPKHNVTIEGGTNSGGEEIEVGQTVTITAGKAPEGKEFDKWVVVSGEVTLANANNESTTFVMPNGAVEIKATYKDKTPSGGEDNPGGEITPPAKKDGLSGGAIAGIVVGSVAVVGVGGFAIFWFAIKKKSFAELIATIKGLFAK